MFRRLVLAGVSTGLFALVCTDLSACGDKFMRVGRSPTGRHYAALHPSSILIYRPAGSTPKGIADFESLLKKAGHAPRVLQRGEDVAPVLATANYSLLIAEYSDVDTIRKELDTVSAKPGILPILLESNKTVETQLKQDFHCVIRPRAMSDHDALVEIDHALDIRLKDGARTR